MPYRRIFGVLLVTALWSATTVWAQGGAGRGGGAAGGGIAEGLYRFDPLAGSGMAIADAPPIETRQKVTIGGEAIAYTARAGFVALRSATTGQSAAHVFYTAYTRDAGGEAPRPLLVCLGGAPGIAAAWQEFGGFGPKRMKWAADGTAGSPPYGWIDNPQTLLNQADLVFANPVGTSWSRPDQPSRGPEFWTSAGDVASMGETVRALVAQLDRRNAPLFLAAEDAGTGRAAGVATYLIEHQSPVAGVVLLSMQPSADSIAGDEQFITMLPSQILAAWHHKKLTPELQAQSVEKVAELARQFASRQYLHALYQGDRMLPEDRAKVVAELVRLTGMSKTFIVSNNLRLPADRFNAELLREERRGLASSDARIAGHVPAPAGGGRGGFGGGAQAAIDFRHFGIAGGFQSAYEAYLKRELTATGIPGSVLYLSGGGVGTYTATGNSETSLSAAFARNPRLRLFVAMNLFDLGVPFYAAEFTVAHMNVAPEIRTRNITIRQYEAGQMPYLDARARTALRDDLSRFLTETAAAARQ